MFPEQVFLKGETLDFIGFTHVERLLVKYEFLTEGAKRRVFLRKIQPAKTDEWSGHPTSVGKPLDGGVRIHLLFAFDSNNLKI
jgi:hypothetical protein